MAIGIGRPFTDSLFYVVVFLPDFAETIRSSTALHRTDDTRGFAANSRYTSATTRTAPSGTYISSSRDT